MTSKLSGYSTTPANNNAAAPAGWPEGMTAGSVNNATREYAARVREWYEDPMWIDYGHTIVSSTSSSIKVSGDKTAVYVANRPIRVNQSGSQVGYITASAYSAPDTSITVSGFTVSGPTQVEAGAISSSNQLPANLSITAATLASASITAANITTANITTANVGALSITTMTVSGTISVGAITGNVIASDADMEAASSGTVFVSPARVVRSPYAAKAWALFNGSTLSAGSGISSINSAGTGVYSITMAASCSSANYAVFATAIGTVSSAGVYSPFVYSQSKTAFRISWRDGANAAAPTGFSVAVFGDLE